MEFSLLCNYYSYVMGAHFPVWFTCTCLKPDILEKMKEIQTPADGKSVFAQRVLMALRYGDCRLSYRGGGAVVFEGHEFSASPDGESVKIRFDDDCQYTVTPADVISYTE